MNLTYLDHNATTPVRPEVLDAMLPFLKGEYANPSSAHQAGQRARKAVEEAREKVAALLGARQSQEIVFTSCGTESDALAVVGGAWAVFESSKKARTRVVSSPIEHPAIRGALSILENRGFSVDQAGVDGHGVVDLERVKSLLKPETALATVMYANNEVGTLEPIAEIAALCRERGILFHTDAVQAAGKVPLDVRVLGVDLLSISGHKINAPKGIGALYVREGVRLVSQMPGSQEKNRRGGTENVSQIVGLGTACALARKELNEAAGHAEELRSRLTAGVLKIPGAGLNGHPSRRLPNCAHFSFTGIEGHQLLVALDLQGICVSAGPACSAGAAAPSHVLSAMAIDAKLAVSSIRVSWGWSSTEADIDLLLNTLPGAVERLRKVPAKI